MPFSEPSQVFPCGQRPILVVETKNGLVRFAEELFFHIVWRSLPSFAATAAVRRIHAKATIPCRKTIRWRNEGNRFLPLIANFIVFLGKTTNSSSRGRTPFPSFRRRMISPIGMLRFAVFFWGHAFREVWPPYDAMWKNDASAKGLQSQISCQARFFPISPTNCCPPICAELCVYGSMFGNCHVTRHAVGDNGASAYRRKSYSCV